MNWIGYVQFIDFSNWICAKPDRKMNIWYIYWARVRQTNGLHNLDSMASDEFLSCIEHACEQEKSG